MTYVQAVRGRVETDVKLSFAAVYKVFDFLLFGTLRDKSATNEFFVNLDFYFSLNIFVLKSPLTRHSVREQNFAVPSLFRRALRIAP